MFVYNSRQDKYPFGAVSNKENVHIRFGVRKEVTNPTVTLFLHGTNKYVHQFALSPFGEEGEVLYFVVSLRVETAGLYYYHFEVKGENYYYCVGRDVLANAVSYPGVPEWQLTVYDSSVCPTARWGGDIVYHIFVDRFCRANSEPLALSYGEAHEWDDDVSVVSQGSDVYRAEDFFGGDLQGIISKLDYLKDLGVTILYLSPIFQARSNHRYDTGDYSKIDPMIGTEEDFAELVGKARIRGMRIMLDGVFNHTGSDSLYFNKDGRYDSFGACQGTASPYRDWYTIYKTGGYKCWWGIDNVPTLNKENKSLRRYLFGKDGILAHWSRYDIDWRLDVVDELPDFYLDELRNAVKTANPTSTIIGEVWEDATTKVAYGVQRQYFTKGQIDGVMNYVFRSAILAYGGGGSAYDFEKQVMNVVENYPRGALDNCLTLLGSHDTIRPINVLAGVTGSGWSKQQQRDYRLSPDERIRGVYAMAIAATLQYMLPGMPSLFYGDEVGVQGFEDPICRRSFPWGNPNEILLDFYKRLGRVRAHVASSLRGPIRFANVRDLLVMLRGEGAGEIAVVANNTMHPITYPSRYSGCTNLLTGEHMDGDIFIPAMQVMVLKPDGEVCE